MKDIKFFKEIIFNFKGILFRNQDIISGVELVEYGIVSKDTKNILKLSLIHISEPTRPY